MTISKPEVSTGSTLCLLVSTLCPRNINIYINHKKLRELEDKIKLQMQKSCTINFGSIAAIIHSIPSSCSFSTALFTKGVISVD